MQTMAYNDSIDADNERERLIALVLVMLGVAPAAAPAKVAAPGVER